MAVGTRMLQRRATEAVWNVSPYVLASGELGVTTDTGIIKIGDGANLWPDLDPAFDSQFLPLLGKAADSELLDGIGSESFLKVVDATTAATADKIAKRLGDGKLKAAAGSSTDDVVNYDQMVAANLETQKESIVRTVTGATTLAATDVNKMVFVNHASLTVQVVVTVPLNATVAIPVGSWIDVCSIGAGGAKLTPSGGVTLSGTVNVFPNYGVVRILKTGTDTWLGISLSNQKQSRLPKIRITRSTGSTYPAGYSFIPYQTVDSTVDFYNPDNEWFSIPGTGLSTARRVIVNKTGEYLVVCNFNSSADTRAYIRICLMVADNTLTGGRVLSAQSFYIVGNATARFRLTAGESIGVQHQNEANAADNPDGTSGDRNDLTITRLGD